MNNNINITKFPITYKGYNNLSKEIKHLKYIERPKAIEAISAARDFGDLSENTEYQAAREKQSFIEGRILELEDKIARAEIINTLKLSNDNIKFGATVTLIDDETEKIVTYHITGEYEADITKKRISIISPIAKALIGKKIGDIVEVITPKGIKIYEVLNIIYQNLD